MSNKNNNYGGKKRGKAKKVIAVIAVALCAFLVGAGVASATAPKKINPKNLLNEDVYVENLIESTTGGLKVDFKDDCTFSISGKHTSDDTQNNSKYRYQFASVTLEPGEYQISSGNKRCDTEKYGLYYILGTDYVEVLKDVKTFAVEETTVVQVGFFVKNNEYIIYAGFEPVLVAKGETTTFYID